MMTLRKHSGKRRKCWKLCREIHDDCNEKYLRSLIISTNVNITDSNLFVTSCHFPTHYGNRRNCPAGNLSLYHCFIFFYQLYSSLLLFHRAIYSLDKANLFLPSEKSTKSTKIWTSLHHWS